MDPLATALQQALDANAYSLAIDQFEQLCHYLKLLQQWNKVYNLTAITAPHEMALKHIVDSLAIAPYLQGKRILDLGSGAGLPGFPLAIIQPGLSFTLVDSNGKKTRFMTHAKQQLKLEHIEIVQTRVENFEPDVNFDSITSRAFSSLQQMLTLSHDLINNDGVFLAMKGLVDEKELQEIDNAIYSVKIHPLAIKGISGQRHLMEIRLKETTDNE